LTRGVELEAGRKGGQVHRMLRASTSSKDALVRVEAEAYLASCPVETLEGGSNFVPGPSEANIIQVGKQELRAAWGAKANGAEGRLKGQREEKGAQRIALLNTGFGSEGCTVEEEARRATISPFSPRSQARKPEPDLPQHTQTIDGVEGILEVQAEEDHVRLAGRALAPLAGSVDGSFGPHWDGDPDLQRMEVIPRQVFHCVTQAFGDKASQGFANGNWADISVPFW
jgi:hypothetical protein